MSNLLLNLDELNIRHERSEYNRIKLFDDILKMCHNKIKKYNKEFKKQECLFSPPPFIIGKPPYNYIDLLNYIIDSLNKNGLKAQWLPDKQSLYVSWKPGDVDLSKYQSHFTSAVYGDNYDDKVTVMAVRPTPSQVATKKPQKKKAGQEKPILQHVAMLEYNNSAQDLIPINIKGLRRGR